MPSGLTYALEDKNFNVQKWLIEDISRQFGFMMSFRDEPQNLDYAELRKGLTKDEDSSYDESCIKTATAQLAVYKKLTAAQWKKSYEAAKAKSLKEFNENLAKKLELKAKYTKALNQIRGIKNNHVSEKSHVIVRNAVDHAIKCITDSMSWDFDGLTTKFTYPSFASYKKSMIDGVTHDINYHTKKILENKTRKAEKIEYFDAYVNFVKSVTNG